jgi:predicted hotdog family 3-hydroxylacyl-ACP dehydratase
MKNTLYTDMAEILPHKPPMIFIDGVAEYDLEKRTVVAYFIVTKEKHFYDHISGGVPSWTGIEYMAQAIGTLAGINSSEKGEAPSLAFLLGTRSFEVFIDFFTLNTRYDVHVSENFADVEMGSYRCLIYDNNNFLCAAADINTYLPKDIDKVLKR